MTTQCDHGFELPGNQEVMCDLELNHTEYHMGTIFLDPHGFHRGRVHWSDEDDQDFKEVIPREGVV